MTQQNEATRGWGPASTADVVLAALGEARITIDKEGYPGFSEAELDNRRSALMGIAAAAEVDVVVVNEEFWNGSAVPWLTGWLTTRQATLVISEEVEDRLFVQHHNHLPQARRVARNCVVDWGGSSTVHEVVGELRRRSANRVGWIGNLASAVSDQLKSEGFIVADLTADYVQARMIKTSEELDWLRVGAYLSDRAIEALSEQLRPGISEFEVADIIERAYVPLGGTTLIHHIGVTPMSDPVVAVPTQHRSFRRLEPGDAVVVEISAAWWGYAGQVLRTFVLGDDPTELYQRLHDVAEDAAISISERLRAGATAEDLVKATLVIEEAGFTVIDDVIHGFGGGYLPPVLGSTSRPAGPVPELKLAENMTVVVQPNVTTKDWKAGVQTGELYKVTAGGGESLHQFPPGLIRVTPGGAGTKRLAN